MQETQIQSLVWEDPLKKEMAAHWQPTVFLPRKSYGQRSLAVYSPWGRKESDTPERLSLSLSWYAQEESPNVSSCLSLALIMKDGLIQ